jgi:hypothetical protein
MQAVAVHETLEAHFWGHKFVSHKDDEREVAVQCWLIEMKEDVRRSGSTGNDGEHHIL